MRAAAPLVVVALLATTSHAFGDSPKSADSAAADALFKDALAAKDANNWDAACPKFLESQKLEPAAGTLLYVSECHERGGRLGSAWEAVREAIYLMPSTDERLTRARQRLAALEKSAPKLKIRLGPGAPAGATVTLDGLRISSENLGVATPVDAGEHVVVASAPGRAEGRFAVRLASGASEEVTVEPSSRSIPSAVARADDAKASEGGADRTLGYVLVAAGIAGLATAGVTGAMLISKHSTVADHCNTSTRTCDSPEGVAAASDAKGLLPVHFIGVGVTIAGALGAYFYFSSRPTPTSARIRLAPMGARLEGGFLPLV